MKKENPKRENSYGSLVITYTSPLGTTGDGIWTCQHDVTLEYQWSKRMAICQLGYRPGKGGRCASVAVVSSGEGQRPPEDRIAERSPDEADGRCLDRASPAHRPPTAPTNSSGVGRWADVGRPQSKSISLDGGSEVPFVRIEKCAAVGNCKKEKRQQTKRCTRR